MIAASAIASAQAARAPAPATAGPASTAPPNSDSPAQLGSVSGTVMDQSGAIMANVKVSLEQQGLNLKRETVSDGDGHFIFTDVSPGPFQITFTNTGFASLQISGVLHPGESYVVPQIAMAVAQANVDVQVTLPLEQVAEDELKVEEKQRVLGFIPNFYVSYLPNAVALPTKLKFQLAWKSVIDPVSFAITGAVAGVQQAENNFAGYGQGAAGYARRYGAAYGDLVSGTFIGGAILPSLLHQDPRYFYKGTGSAKSRLLYAIAMSVVCKGDNGRWQPNYSGIIGGLAAGGISNLYYPAQSRNGLSLTFENALIGIGGSAASNVIQEFIVRRFTPHLAGQEPARP
ncbi:MAG: carboxypeptidase-like regulatory domain-containing protein [Candidatus Sulfotelmatobacter sp.]